MDAREHELQGLMGFNNRGVRAELYRLFPLGFVILARTYGGRINKWHHFARDDTRLKHFSDKLDWLMDNDYTGLWKTAPVRCSVCNNRWVSVGEIITSANHPFEGLECPRCHHMSGAENVPGSTEPEAD